MLIILSLAGDLPDTLNIHANELFCEESKGGIVRKVESPIDKIERIGDIFGAVAVTEKVIMYNRDSAGDFLCLLKAHIGIVIGICAIPLLSGFIEKQKDIVEGRPCGWSPLSGMLYTVSRWTELDSLLVGLEHTEESSRI